MSNKEATEGVVTEILADGKFRVEFPDGVTLIAYSSGKMRLHGIKVLIGDKVMVEIDPYGGKATNRMIRRLT